MSSKMDDDYVPGTEKVPDDDYVLPDSSEKSSTSRKSRASVSEDQSEVSLVARSYLDLSLKPDHEARPIWITKDRTVYLETWSQLYQVAYDLLVAISEPRSRPEFVHEYEITVFSLYAAASIGLSTEEILGALEKLCKVQVPEEVQQFIKTHTTKCGKVKFVLRQGHYYLESPYKDLLLYMLQQSDSVRNAVVHRANADENGLVRQVLRSAEWQPVQIGDTATTEKQIRSMELFTVEISASQNEEVRRATQHDLGIPMMEEYDFRADRTARQLDMALRPVARIRPYQEQALNKMFGNGRARSGIIVLPCGAGKTLVGISATATVRKATLILTSTSVSVNQWKGQLERWSTIPSRLIVAFTAADRAMPPEEVLRGGEPCIVISTYSMMAHRGTRSAHAQAMTDFIAQREWGLLVMDEVHVTPARSFRRCMTLVKARCKLGLTATLLREDALIQDLFFLIGPKLFEANWLDLQRDGYLAKVQCLEIRCPMSPEFAKRYLSAKRRKKHHEYALLYVFNPNKFRACEMLALGHAARGDKVLVFADSVPAIEEYNKRLGWDMIIGKTPEKERRVLLAQFQRDATKNVLLISRVGDVAIDLPDVNVIIQISSHFASRRQEAQRLGRILRPKARSGSAFNAFFYSLVSADTKEVSYASKRQRFLVDQGYSFHVVDDVVDEATPGLMFSRPQERADFLAHVLGKYGNIDVLAEDDSNIRGEDKEIRQLEQDRKTEVRTRMRLASDLSGATGRRYTEFNVPLQRTHVSQTKRQRTMSKHKILKQHEQQRKLRQQAHQDMRDS
ncbi:MAG: hypothetical protein MHM6MM_005869 [Cercozoa sp. M6MM]